MAVKPICLAYADESSTSSRYFGVGTTIFLPPSPELETKAYRVLKGYKTQNGLKKTAHIKWTKVPSKPGRYLSCYERFIRQFLDSARLNFSCLVVDTSKYPLDSKQFFRGAKDAGMDSFMYYLLSRRVLSPYWSQASEFVVRMDRRRRPDNIGVRHIKTRLAAYCQEQFASAPRLHVRQIEGRRHPIIDINDLLLGATMARWNARTRSECKMHLVHVIEDTLGRRIDTATAPQERKFNVWVFRPSGDFGLSP